MICITQMTLGGMAILNIFLKSAIGVKATLGLCLRNVNDCNVGIID
jgi:hypothetical protein